MKFGKRQVETSGRPVTAGLGRQLLPLVLLLAIGGMVLALRGWWGTSPGPSDVGPTPAPPDPSAGGETAVLPGGAVPFEPTDPDPWTENPVVLAEAAGFDRTSTPHDPALAYLIQRMRARSGEIERTAPVLSLEREERVWEELLRDPHLYRGKPVEVKGYLIGVNSRQFPLELHGLDVPNPSGVDRCFRSYLYGTDNRYYMVFTFEKQKELYHQDTVLLEGYFLQLYTNDVEHRGQVRKATIPILVGRDFVPFSAPKVAASDASAYVPVLIVLAMIAFAVVYLANVFAQRSLAGRRARARAELEAARAQRSGSPAGMGTAAAPGSGEE